MFCRIISEGHKQDVFLLGGSDNKVHLYKEVGCYPSYNMNKIGYIYVMKNYFKRLNVCHWLKSGNLIVK